MDKREEEEAQRLRAEAHDRDRRADADDYAADKRDMAANLEGWLHDDDKLSAAYDHRQAAARDRTDARADRDAAAEKRAAVAAEEAPGPSDVEDA